MYFSFETAQFLLDFAKHLKPFVPYITQLHSTYKIRRQMELVLNIANYILI